MFETISRNANQSVAANPGKAFANASTSPIIKPDATIAGKIGTNTSPRVLTILCGNGWLAAAAAFTSSLVAADNPVTAKNSS